jgi:biopolymer transport protein ExbB
MPHDVGHVRCPRSRLVRAALCVLIQLAAMSAAQAAWWNGDWKYRIKIDADAGPKGANIGEPIGRTQVLVRLLANNFKFDTAKQDGGDIRFVAGDDRTPLHYHVEKFDGLVDEVALIWVDVPDLAPGATTSFYMYWGNDKANDASDSRATYDSDQLLVWHFGEEGPPKDSTAFNNNALTPGKRDQAAIIGFGTLLDGTNPIKLTPNPTLNIAAGQSLTWQVWLKPKPANQTALVYDQRDAAGTNDLQIGLDAGVPSISVTSASGTVKAAATAPLVADSWHLLSVTADATKITLFVDGVKAGEAAGAMPAVTGGGVLGGVSGTLPAGAAAPANFVGEMDELQISKAARPAGEIAVAEHDQGTQSNLLAFESPEQTSSFGSGYIGIILKSVTADAWVVIGVLIFMMIVSWLVMISKALYVGRVAGQNKKFLLLMREVNRKGGGLLPGVPREKARAVSASCLYRVYETGAREVNDRLEGGRTLPDGSIAPQSLAAIRSSMDAQMVRETAKLNSSMVFLTIAISGGPFVGLLGTVIGVMITFAAIAAAGDVNVNSIAPGISAALLATATGMFVAIPALFGYNYFQTRIKGVVSEMAVFVDEVVTRIAEGDLARGKPAPGE